MRVLAIVAVSTLLLAACDAKRVKQVPRPLAKKADFAVYAISATRDANTKTDIDPETGQEIYLTTPAVITSTDVASVHLTEDSPEGPSLNVILTPMGAAKVSRAVGKAKKIRLAILVSDKIVSVPVLRPTLWNSLQIRGEKSSLKLEAVFNLLTQESSSPP